MSEQRWILTSDGDGHWYLCPAERQEEAAAMWEAMDKYYHRGDYDGDPPPEPDFVVHVGGPPSAVTFERPGRCGASEWKEATDE